MIAQTDAILVKDLPADICGPGLPEPITTAPGAGAIEAPFDAARAALREALKRDTAVADLVRTRAQDLTAEGRAESAAVLEKATATEKHTR